MTKPIYVKDSTFENDVLNAETPVLVDFYADWCAPCRAITPILDEIADEEKDSLTVAKVDIDTNTTTATAYQVESIPTLILFKDGNAVSKWVGITPKEQLVKEINSYISAS